MEGGGGGWCTVVQRCPGSWSIVEVPRVIEGFPGLSTIVEGC